MTLKEMKEELALKIQESDNLDKASQDYLDMANEIEQLNNKIEASEQAQAKIDKLKQHKPKSKSAGLEISESAVVTGGNPGFVEDPKKGFKNSGEFLHAIYKANENYNSDERLAHIMQTAGTHNTISDGLVIPEEFAQGLLLNESDAKEDWVDQLIVEPTSLNSKTFNRSASNTLGGSVGIQVSRIQEDTQMTSTKEKFENTTLTLNKLYAYSEVTEEELEDIPWLQSHLMMQVPKLMKVEIAKEVLNGTGVGKCLGMFNTNNSNKIAVTRNTGSDIKAVDITTMLSRFIDGPGSFWVANRSILAKLPLITVGDDGVIWNDFQRSGNSLMLNGKPLYISEDCEALGTQGDLRLINPNGYRLLEKVGGSNFASSIHVKFDYDKTAFRWTHRINGTPWANDVYTPRKGSTLSPFVELN